MSARGMEISECRIPRTHSTDSRPPKYASKLSTVSVGTPLAARAATPSAVSCTVGSNTFGPSSVLPFAPSAAATSEISNMR